MREQTDMSGKVKRKLSKRSIAYVAVGIALISLMTVIGMSAFLRTAQITVEGASTYSPDLIIQASGLSVGDNLMFVNTQNVSQQIRAGLPFISEANVSRILPDTILIEVVESIAVARVTSAGSHYVVDSNCRVLASSNSLRDDEVISDLVTDFEYLIEIIGIEIEETALGTVLRPVFGAEAKLQYAQDILAALERHRMTDDVSYINVSSIVNVFFGYMGRYRVILGGSTSLRPGSIRHNLDRLAESIPQIQERYPNTPGDINLSDETAPPNFTPT